MKKENIYILYHVVMTGAVRSKSKFTTILQSSGNWLLFNTEYFSE